MTTNVLNTLYTDAVDTTKKTYLVDPDNVQGFNGNWSCNVPLLRGGIYFEFECSRFLPKPTKTNTYTGDFRFSPKMTVGGTNPTPPTVKMHIWNKAVMTVSAVDKILEHHELKSATTLAVSATIALATAVLF